MRWAEGTGFAFGCGVMLSPAQPLQGDDSGILCIDCQSSGHSRAAHSFLVLSALLQPWKVH